MLTEGPSEPPVRPASAELVGLTLVLLAAGWARLTSWPSVLVAGELLPSGGDSAYHLHRAMRTLETFPVAPVHDPWINWPAGGPCHWAPGFDVLLALPAWMIGASDAAPTLAAFVPVALGIVQVVLAVLVARAVLPDDRTGRTLALVAGAALIAMPQSVSIGRFGRTDHHVVEALGMAALGLWALRRPDGHPALKWELAGAAVTVGALVCFAGSVLYVAVVSVVLGVESLLRGGPRGRAGLGSGGPAMLIAAAAIAAVYAPGIGQHGHAFSYVYPSWLQPALVAFAGLGLLALDLLASRIPGQGPGVAVRRGLAFTGLGLAGAGVLLLAGPGAQVLDALGGFIGRKDPWLAGISEFQSTLTGPPWRPSSWAQAVLLLGWLGPAAVVLLLFGAHAAIREPARLRAFAVWTLPLVVLALQQQRFVRVVQVNLAVLVALAGHRAAVRLAGTGARPPLVAAGIAAALLLQPPSARFLRPAAARSLAAIEEAAGFLDMRGVEPTSGDGALAAWDMGHPLVFLAGRPVVSTGFGSFLDKEGYQAVEAGWRGTPEQLDELMVQRELGWVVAGAATFFERIGTPDGRRPFVRLEDGRGVIDQDYLRQRPVSALVVAGSGLPDGTSPHLPHLRPVYASRATSGGLSFALPVLFVYERVPGARLVGAAASGTAIRLRVELDLRGQSWPWVATTEATPDGRWELTVPLATGSRGGGVTVREAWLKVGDGEPVKTTIPLRAVTRGELVPTDPEPREEVAP